VTELLPAGSATPDLVFEPGPDLPQALVHSEGLRSIVVNLVENARKYAAPGANGRSFDPIRISTHVHKRLVVLEVADRGPGIPASERDRIFDAFYRIGNEATRTSQGTGLGLHLVALQARSMEAKVSVLPRKGGGTVFRVMLKAA